MVTHLNFQSFLKFDNLDFMPEGISWLQLFWNDTGVQSVERWWKKISVIIVENTPDQNWWISGQIFDSPLFFWKAFEKLYIIRGVI